MYLRLLLEQTDPQDEKAGYGGSQFRLFERSELRNCRLGRLSRGARKSCLKYKNTASFIQRSLTLESSAFLATNADNL